MNIFCILVHVPDRNTKNRWFVASAPRIFRLFTNLSSGLLVNLSRPRCISNYRERGEFRFCKLFETHTWCTCYTNFIRPAFLKFSWLPPALVFHAHLHILIFLHPPFSLYHAIYFSPKKIYIFFFLYRITERLYQICQSIRIRSFKIHVRIDFHHYSSKNWKIRIWNDFHLEAIRPAIADEVNRSISD